MNTKSLFKISDLTKEEIFEILHDANAFSCSHKDWQLPERKLVANLFLNRAPERIFPLPVRSIS